MLSLRLSLFKNLLLKNAHARQIVFKNTFWLGFSELISRLLEFILIVFIIRQLGTTEFGRLAFALSFASIVVIMFELGISDITTRELAADQEARKEYNAIFSLKAVLSIIALVFIAAASFFITSDPATRLAIVVLGVFMLINELFSFLYSFLRAIQKMELEAAFKIIRSLLLFFFVTSALWAYPTLIGISYGYLFANIAALVLVLLFFHFRVHVLELCFDKNIWARIIRISWPLGLATIFGAVIVNGDSVIMGYLGQITENGWYNASRKVASAIVMISTFIFISFYPLLSRLFNESKGKLQVAWNYYLQAMIMSAVPIASAGFFIAPRLIHVIFGPDFGPSVIVFKIVIFVVAIIFLYHPYHLLLVVCHQQKKIFWAYLISLAVNLLLNAALIPSYSLYGAATSLLATYVVLFLFVITFSKRVAPIAIFNENLAKVFAVSLFASVITVAAIVQMLAYSVGLFYAIGAGIAAYVLVLYSLYRLLHLSPRFLQAPGQEPAAE